MKHKYDEKWLKNTARLYNKLSDKKFTIKRYCRMESIRIYAEKFLTKFRDNNVEINEKNARGWALFVDAFAVGDKEKLLDRLQNSVSFDVRNYIAKEKSSFWKNLFVREIKKKKHHNSSVKKKIKNVWSRWGNKIKTVIIGSAVIAGGIFGVKSCDNDNRDDSNVVVSNKALINKDSVSSNVVYFSEVADDVKKEKDTSVKDSINVKHQKIWNNFYDIRVEMFSSSNEKDKLYAKIDKQIKDGFLELKDGISKERVAYCYLIYKEYGVKSSIKDVIFADKKVDSKTMQQFYSDIMSAGDKGLGVKEKAEKIKGNKLTNYSKSDRASHELKTKSIKNLKELRDFKKMYKNM